MRFSLAFAALAASTAFATPAFAQATLPSSDSDVIQATALLIQPATIQGVDDLSFGTLIATATGAGNVTINPNTGARTVPAGITGSGVDVGQRGRFLGNGLPTQEVQLTANFPAFLSNEDDPTQTVEFSGLLDTAAQTGTITIGNTGVFYVGVGGTITIDAGQMPGRYSGEIEVTADFQ